MCAAKSVLLRNDILSRLLLVRNLIVALAHRGKARHQLSRRSDGWNGNIKVGETEESLMLYMEVKMLYASECQSRSMFGTHPLTEMKYFIPLEW